MDQKENRGGSRRFPALQGRILLFVALGFAALIMADFRADAAGLIVGKASEPETLDPAVAMDNNAWTVTYPCYQRLLRRHNVASMTEADLAGELALSWRVNPDGTKWIFVLRETARFADGAPVTADAVVFSFQRLQAIGGGPNGFFPTLKGVEALDSRTVRFHLVVPFAPFLETLTTNAAAIVDPRIATAEDPLGRARLNRGTAGSGAYALTGWSPGREITLRSNRHGSAPAPAFDEVRIRFLPGRNVRREALQAGIIDLAEGLDVAAIDALEPVEGIRIVRAQSLSMMYLYLNNRQGALQDKVVRTAIAHGINYDRLLREVFAGAVRRLRGPVPVGIWGHDRTLRPPDYDPAKAAELLAGRRESSADDDERRELRLLYSERDPYWEPIARRVRTDLAAIGLTVVLDKQSHPVMRKRLDEGRFDIAVGNWFPDFADPYMTLNLWFDSNNHGLPGNRAFFSDPEVDTLLRAALRTDSRFGRFRIYRNVQQLVAPQHPYVYLAQRTEAVAVRADLQGMRIDPAMPQVYDFANFSRNSAHSAQ